MPCVYLIQSTKTSWIYVGSTENLEKRLQQHNQGQVRSTKFRAPYRLIHHEIYDTLQEARRREKEIKQVRKVKEELLRKLNGPIV